MLIVVTERGQDLFDLAKSDSEPADIIFLGGIGHFLHLNLAEQIIHIRSDNLSVLPIDPRQLRPGESINIVVLGHGIPGFIQDIPGMSSDTQVGIDTIIAAGLSSCLGTVSIGIVTCYACHGTTPTLLVGEGRGVSTVEGIRLGFATIGTDQPVRGFKGIVLPHSFDSGGECCSVAVPPMGGSFRDKLHALETTDAGIAEARAYLSSPVVDLDDFKDKAKAVDIILGKDEGFYHSLIDELDKKDLLGPQLISTPPVDLSVYCLDGVKMAGEQLIALRRLMASTSEFLGNCRGKLISIIQEWHAANPKSSELKSHLEGELRTLNREIKAALNPSLPASAPPDGGESQPPPPPPPPRPPSDGSQPPPPPPPPDGGSQPPPSTSPGGESQSPPPPPPKSPSSSAALPPSSSPAGSPPHSLVLPSSLSPSQSWTHQHGRDTSHKTSQKPDNHDHQNFSKKLRRSGARDIHDDVSSPTSILKKSP